MQKSAVGSIRRGHREAWAGAQLFRIESERLMIAGCAVDARPANSRRETEVAVHSFSVLSSDPEADTTLTRSRSASCDLPNCLYDLVGTRAFAKERLPGTGRAATGEKPVAYITGSAASCSRQRSAIYHPSTFPGSSADHVKNP
jgi:hypothetical protein